MEISGITRGFVNNSIESAKSNAVQDDFERMLQDAIANKDEKRLKEACKEFEGIMLSMMFKQMRNTIPKSDLIPSDAGRDIFESMLDEALMEEASKGRGIGLADVLYKQLSRNLAAQKPENLAGQESENIEGNSSKDEIDITSVKGESSGG